MAVKGTFCQRSVLLLLMLLLESGLVDGCLSCPRVTLLSQFPSELPTEACCLNYSGSAFSHVSWPAFTNETNVQILDLSRCNISSIHMNTTGVSDLKEVYLSRNSLATLPEDFLANEPSLKVLDLGMNLLRELPVGFLQNTESLEQLNLQGNQLRSLPGSVLQSPGLLRLELGDNPWDCSCSQLETLERQSHGNRTTSLRDLVGNMTCASPRHLAGRSVWSAKLSDACRPPGLTALFILLPLLILTALVLCWCCGRKRKRKETPAFGSSKKKASGSNGQQKHRPKEQPPADGETPKAGGDSGSKGILKNQLLLRPASALLGSTRDIYEEVVIKVGSVESLPRAPSHCSTSTEGRRGSQGPEAGGKAELDTVSVTEVMKDSADREKAYLTQSTEYYSLVPGMDLDDSDHAEYESVDLS